MGWALEEFTAPTKEPITTDEAKAHLRVDITDDDTLIDSLVNAARLYAEGFTSRALITQTWDLFLDDFPASPGRLRQEAIIVPKAPLQSITTVKYLDTAGDQQTLAASKYRVDAKSHPGRITPAYGEVWPTTRGVINAVEVRFIAGYGDAETDVPQQIIQGMLMLIGHLYENREAVIVGTTASNVPQATEYLLWPYRLFRF
ncbi:MAG: head-tail connector protein [bacterium]|nr:head-tail connector protein [bacterium]